jgi:hypothetical protein
VKGEDAASFIVFNLTLISVKKEGEEVGEGLMEETKSMRSKGTKEIMPH